MKNKSLSLMSLAAACGAVWLTTACAPLLVGGAVAGGALVATDRRSVGIQLEDEAIERRINRALAEKFFRDAANISVSSYNRKVLLTGEVTQAQFKDEAGSIAQRSENVRDVLNEVQVGILSTLSSRTADSATTAKVKAALLEEKGLPSTAIRVVTERSAVYLMGRVTDAEGNLAAKVASRVGGVKQVVKVFEALTPAEVTEAQKAAEPRK